MVSAARSHRISQSLGMKPKVIQASLRHSDISVALDFYVETPKEEAREALERLPSLI